MSGFDLTGIFLIYIAIVYVIVRVLQMCTRGDDE